MKIWLVLVAIALLNKIFFKSLGSGVVHMKQSDFVGVNTNTPNWGSQLNLFDWSETRLVRTVRKITATQDVKS